MLGRLANQDLDGWKLGVVGVAVLNDGLYRVAQ